MSLNALKKFLAALVLAACLVAVPVYAQEGKAEAKTEKTEKSEKDESAMNIWKWANFLLLAGVLGWLIKGNLGPALTARSKEIADSLAAGEKAKAEAEAQAKAIDAKLAGLSQQIASLRAEAAADRDREAVRIRKEADAEMVRLEQRAGIEIEAAAKAARAELQRAAAILAVELAEKKIRTGITPELGGAMVDNFIRRASGENRAS